VAVGLDVSVQIFEISLNLERQTEQTWKMRLLPARNANLKLMKILSRKAGKLDVALFSKKSGASYVSTSSSVPTSVVSQVIRYISVHEIQVDSDIKRKLRICK
jgi:hypothetical protein